MSKRTVTIVDAESMAGDLEIVLKAINKSKFDCRTVIKLRSRTNALLFEQFSKSVEIVSTDLQKVLRKTDVLIMRSSTVGLEAMILGKPVISFLNKENKQYPKDVVFYAKNEKELTMQLNKVFEMFPPTLSVVGVEMKRLERWQIFVRRHFVNYLRWKLKPKGVI